LYQTANSPIEHWQVALEGRGAEVLVHLMETVHIARKFSGPIASIVEADGRIHE